MYCVCCGATSNLNIHHIFYGTAKRKTSDKYDDICTAVLCFTCHRKLHDGRLPSLDRWLKMNAQRKFEEKYSHELFMQEFRRNYL